MEQFNSIPDDDAAKMLKSVADELEETMKDGESFNETY